MAKVELSIPALYADHHVLRIRDILFGLEGISDAVVSSARRVAVVDYDESKVSAERIIEALKAAGYLPGEEVPLPEMPERSKDGSPWFSVLSRDTVTIAKDLEMSGDFRRY